MAVSSLIRLFIVILILIALALTTGAAWGSFSLLGTTDTPTNAVHEVQTSNSPVDNAAE